MTYQRKKYIKKERYRNLLCDVFLFLYKLGFIKLITIVFIRTEEEEFCIPLKYNKLKEQEGYKNILFRVKMDIIIPIFGKMDTSMT